MTFKERWTIGTGGEKERERAGAMLPARLDDGDDDDC